MKTKIELTEKEIDFNTPQLLVSIGDGPNIIVLSSGDHGNHIFTGTAIAVEDKETCDLGELSISWRKEEFKLFTGKLTLEND